MNCTHCQKKLSNGAYKKSAEIPHNPSHHYVMCNGCGNVMVGRFVNGELQHEELGNRFIPGLHSTPTSNNESTIKQMIEAAKLFKEAGINVGQYSFDEKSSKKSISDLETKEKLPKQTPQSEAIEQCKPEPIPDPISEIDVKDSDNVLEEEPVFNESQTFTEDEVNMEKDEVLESNDYTHPPVTTLGKIKSWFKNLFRR